MAYVFSNLNDAMQGGNSNIFGGASVSSAGQGSDTPIKQGEGGGSAVGGSSGASGTASAPAPKPPQAVDQTGVLSKQGFQSMPGFVGNIQNESGATQKAQDSDVAAYNTAQANKGNGAIGDYTLSRAGTDPTAYATVATRLSNQTGPQADAYKPSTDLTTQEGKFNSDVSSLQDPYKLQNMLQLQGGSQYTAGMSALDRQLLGQNQGFQQTRNNLIQQNQKLQATDTSNTANLQNQAQTNLDAAYKAETDAIKANLAKQEAGIIDPLTAKAAAENAARQGLTKTPDQTFVQTQSQNALQALIAQNPSLAQYLSGGAGVDASKYFGVGGQVSASDYANAAQAAQYSKLQALLGNGGSTLLSGTGPSARETFDTQGFDQAAMAAAQQEAQDAQLAAAVQQGTATPAQKETLMSDYHKLVGAGGKLSQFDQWVGQMGAKGLSYLGAGQGTANSFGNAVTSLGAGQTLQGLSGAAENAQGSLQGAGGGLAGAGQAVYGQGSAIGNAGGKAASAAHKVFSDIKAKTNIATPSSDQIHNFLGNLQPKTYNYKNPAMGEGPQLGVMAQDMEKSPLGASAVSQGPNGMKQIDYGKLFPAITAALADQNERIRAIEARKKRG